MIPLLPSQWPLKIEENEDRLSNNNNGCLDLGHFAVACTNQHDWSKSCKKCGKKSSHLHWRPTMRVAQKHRLGGDEHVPTATVSKLLAAISTRGPRLGKPSDEHRGLILLDSFAELDTILVNFGCVPTFRGRELGPIVDPRWRKGVVSGHYTHSDNRAIFLDIRGRRKRQSNA